MTANVLKTRFNSYDIVCAVTELQRLVGLRVNQIYDIDNKTYLFRFQGGEAKGKEVLLIESGIRLHTTAFEWPKNVAPSGFSMKLRKHLKNKRLEKLQQLGADRIIDFQFGANEAAYHVILELYDRGNIVLTDHELTILYILRTHSDGEEVRFAVREKYPINRAKEEQQLLEPENVKNKLLSAPAGENLRRCLMFLLDCGPAVIDHVLISHKLDNRVLNYNANTEEAAIKEVKKGRKQKKNASAVQNSEPFNMDKDLSTLMLAIQNARDILNEGRTTVSKGYIVQKREEKPTTDQSNSEHFLQNMEYHPYRFVQYEGQPLATFETFMLAVDEFYSSLESQKIDLKTIQQERDALKKLSNVKKDHAKRLEDLAKVQETDKQKAELITRNQELVDKAILAIRSAIANQMSWPDIHELVKAAQANGDVVASTIKQLKLEINHISLYLTDPYDSLQNSDVSEGEEDGRLSSQVIDVDLSLSAWGNACKYYDQKRSAAQKEQKTIDASQKALKSAERKTQQTLKDVRTISTISKARKVYWFEKFYWFISSENYLVIGGRDAQQNELIVKRYMRPSDVYVHAEIQGASSVVICNSSESEIPPKTLLEAGTMAISYSVAWDAKVVTNAYWVRSEQVSKTAPSGEYLGTGSFMIRGKKNFLPPCHLVMGLSLLFKVEDEFVKRHLGERRVRVFEDEEHQLVEEMEEVVIENEQLDTVAESDEGNVSKNISQTAEDEPQANDADSENEEEDEDATNFPDIQVKVEHDTGHVTVKAESIVNETVDAIFERKQVPGDLDNDETTIIPAAPARRKQQQNAKKRKEEKNKKSKDFLKQQQENALQNQNNPNSSQMKRGQKGKLKKIRAKYKDQDEEEREMRMQILKSAGKDKPTVDTNEIAPEPMISKNKVHSSADSKQQPENDLDDIDELPTFADVAMIDTLTGQPLEDDELLFAIPVIAPYQALQSYKFKVKLTPGTGKRGRAAKTALAMFGKDKSCGMREKDLIKSIKEEALARNIPGKVKISAPQMQKYKK